MSSRCWRISVASEIPDRSFASAPITTRQPSPSAPRRFETGVRAPSKKTWLNEALPDRFSIGEMVIPGVFIGTSRQVMPLYFETVGSVRTNRKMWLAKWAEVVQIFWP